MGTSEVKQVIVELTRSGCRVETLLYDPPAVTFLTATGVRRALTTEHAAFRLSSDVTTPVSFPTLREALSAATAA